MSMRQEGTPPQQQHKSPLSWVRRTNRRYLGLEKLYNAAGLYIRAMGKKKEGKDREKSLPPEILGQAMISHGGEYAPESAYGQGLLKLGSGMERISRLHEVPTSNPSPRTPLCRICCGWG